MKNTLLIILLVLLTQMSLATELTCIEKIANTVTRKMTIDLPLAKKAS